MLKKRLIVAALLLPPVLGVVWLGGYALIILALACMTVCAYEYYSFAFKPNSRELSQLLLITMLPPVAFLVHSYPGLIAFYYLGLIFLTIKALSKIEKPIHEPKLQEAFIPQFAAYTFLVCFCSNLVITASSENASHAYFWILATVMGTDTGAYFIGKMLGKKKLAPRVSPNKTIAGSVGGLIIGVGLGVFVAIQLGMPHPIYEMVFFGIIASFLCQLGDLFQSLIKRTYEVKDSGTLLPGHGGMFDRIDGLLFAVPVIYFL